MKFKIELKKNDLGRYKARVLSLPGCTTSGKTEEEALQRIQMEIFFHLGVEVVPRAKTRKNLGYYKNRLAQAMVANMSQEKKFSAATTLTGFFLMMVTIWGAGIIFG